MAGQRSFDEAQVAVSRYITDYYSLLKPHTFNGGLTPTTAQAMFDDNLVTCDQIQLTTTRDPIQPL